jgi:agmatine deiminase
MRSPDATTYRLPAEWEPHAATWIAWPHRRQTFLGPFEAIPRVYQQLAEVLARHEPVRVIGSSDVLAEPRALLADVTNIEFVTMRTNDSWVRDTGPVFLVRRDGEDHDVPPRAAVAWGWNAWGGKYPPWNDDAHVARSIAARLGLDTFEPGIVLEGGAIETDGQGTILANERCVVDERRNPGLDRAAMEAAIRGWLCVEKVLWVGGDLAGDDTDGHIDQLARFVAPGRVLVARQPDPTDPNHPSLAANLARLEGLHDAAGRRLEIIPVDIPSHFAFEGTQLPASHLNYYVANGLVVVPTFGGPTDEPALRILEQCFPGRRIEPVDCRELVRGRGALHCITRDEPAAS